MKKKHFSGSALAQYGIIITLLAIILIPLFYMIGKNIFESFKGLNEGLNHQEIELTNSDNNNSNIINNDVFKAGDFGGSPDKPVSKCVNNKCDIDFGEFILSGIPENFNEIIQVGGTSGANDKLLDLIMQIAKQLEANGDLEGAKDFKDLANLGHFIADMQQDFENRADSCQNDTDSSTCLQNKIKEKTNVKIDDTILELLPNANELISSNLSSTFSHSTSIPWIKNQIVNPYLNIDDSFKKYPGYAFVKKFDDIMNNPKYSNSLKGVTTELYLNISDLSKNLDGLKMATSQTDLQDSIKVYDPLTGEQIGFTDYTLNNGLSDILHPETSIGTNLNSALICSSGWNKDTGSKCH